jgi:hypothetical protein
MRGSREEEVGVGVEWGLTWYEDKLRSLNSQMKMRKKMSQKMTIFPKANLGFDFPKMIIFDLIFKFIFEK